MSYAEMKCEMHKAAVYEREVLLKGKLGDYLRVSGREEAVRTGRNLEG